MDEVLEFRLSVARTGPCACTIAVGGELDLYSCPELKEAIRSLPDEVTDVTLDLTNATFIDSAGLGILVTAAKKTSPQRVALLVRDYNILKVLAITGLDRLFEIRDTARQSSSVV
ncbi:MAG TPA: STAS domain-containing protein [Gaiellaceae bacterium]